MKNIEKNYVGLHNHSHYSLLDGFATVDEYINAAKSMNMIGVGLTDHGTAAGLYEFITKAQSNDLIPIPGVEFYVAPENPDGAKVQKAVYYGPNGNRAPKYDVGGNGAHLHMTVIAYNNKGLENLFKLSTLSWQPEHYYYKPRIDINMLAEHSEGLIVTTGCPSSEINKRFLLKQDRKAYEYAERLKGIFGDNFYVEIMNHNMDEDLEKILLPKLLKLAKDLNLPLLGTNDSHYAYKENASSHERLLAVQSASVMSELGRSKGGTRFDFSGPEYHLKSYEEMYSLYPEDIAEEALANTIKVAEQCADITLEYDPHLRPVIDIPEGFTNVTYLQKLINDGFKAKRKIDDKVTQAESMRRIKEEFEVLHSNDFIDYFLVVHDYIDFAHKNGISIGAGRGCFLPGSKVKGNQGKYKNIEDIKIGEKVQTHDTTYQIVEDTFIYDVEDEDMTEITLSNGKIINSTSDHLIFHKDKGFIKAEDFEVGDIMLGAKARRELFDYACDSCGENIETDKQTFDERASKGHYKPEGEYWCYDCVKSNLHNIPAVKAGSIKGAHKSRDCKLTRSKISESVKKHWADNHEERLAKWHAYIETPAYQEYRERRRIESIELYSDVEMLEKLASQGKSNYKSGYFTSYQQDEKEIYFASSYELKALTILETDSNVKEFDRCRIRVPYLKPSTGLIHNYLPDIEVLNKDGSITIIEVKAKWQLKEEDTYEKLKQAEEFFIERGFNFEVWTEDTFKELNDEWHNDISVMSIKKYKYSGKVYDLQVANVHNYTLEGVTVHNSVGGSEIAYVLDISDTDPIRYDLLFERFLSPGRGSLYHIDYDDGTSEEISVSDKKILYNMETQKKETKYIHELAIGNTIDKDGKPITISNVYVSRPGSAPDVDTDFHTQGREKVIEYVSQKYGKENVANIVTFGTFGSKSAFKTMCTIYQKPFAIANNISAMIPDPIDGKDAKIADLLDEMSMRYNEGEDFRNAVSDGTWDEVIEHSIAIDGRIRNTGVHPCFAAGTLVKTTDGYKPIEDIIVGDKVLTHTNTYKSVVETMINESNDIYKMVTNANTILATGNHPMYIKDNLYSEPKWVNLEDITESQLVGSYESESILWVKQATTKVDSEIIPVYNLSVIDDNSYTANNLITHNCGVIISSVPLSGVVPTQIRQNDGAVVTQWPYPQLESMGLIKMDFLGLENIDIVDATLENIRTIGKEVPDMTELTRGEMDDKKVYEMLGRGDTVGIFQMASPGVRALLQKAQPTKFMDIATITALYRPGPMSTGAHNTWADRLNGSEEVKPLHPEFAGTAVEDILADTAGLVVFQEQLMRIATNFAGMTPYESELLRKAMGKKNMKIMMEMQPKFIEGSIESGGVSEEAAEDLWNTLEGFAEYGFNKCLASRTLISTEDGKVSLEDLYKKNEAGEDIYINSMFEDGEIKLHQVKEVVKSGRKPLYQVVTESGKKIRLTKEHRLLTTNGYGTIEDGGIAIGNSLITDEEWSKRINPNTIKLRQETMSNLNKTELMREQSRQNMTDYQATLTFEDRSEHQKMISETTDRSDKVLTIARERLEELRKDEEWQSSFIDACAKAREKKADSKEYKGFGKVTTLSNGMICDSLVEAAAGEYLISRGVDFEIHKKITNKDGVVKVSDFYANGIYFEMDGLNRGPEYFRENKYGDDIPFVHMTPLNYKDKIDEAIMNHHAKNGDKIVAIIEPKLSKNGEQYTEMTYDIEMMDNGPSNFIADGIVSHNSHSVSYAINAYKNMYLKANYPAEYMAAVIQQKSRDSRTVSQFIQEATNMGLILGPVDINTSQVHVAPTKKGTSDYDIVYGFAAVKQVNLQLAHEIVTERNEHGPYKSVADFAKRITARTKMSSLALANIALAGGFDQFGVSRKMVVEKASNLLSSGNKTASKGVSLFDMIGSSEGDLVEAIELIGEEYSYNEKIKLEADRIGLFISGHPTSELGVVKNSFNSISVSELMKRSHGSEGKVIATFTTINSKTNRQGRRSMEVILDDGSDSMTLYLPKEVIAKSEKFIELQRINQANERGNELKSTKRSDAIAWAMEDESIVPLDLQENDVYLVSLRTRGFGENIKLGITDIERIDTMHNGSLPYKIVVKDNEEYDKIIDILKDNPGETYIECFVEYENETRYTEPINLTRELIMQLERLVGYNNIITQGV